SAQIANGTDPDNDWNQGYGYQFWRCRHGLYRGDGAFGQFCIVMDEYDAVLAMTSAAQDMQQVMNIVWENLLPALQQGTNEQVSEATAHLSEATTGLKLSPLKGLATSPNVLQMSGEYTADANRLGIQGFLLTFSGDTGTLKMQMDDGIETIVAPFGRWQEGTASFFDEIWLDGTLPLLASGAWVAENKYAIQIRLYETPYIYTLNFELQGDMLTEKKKKNVSLISKEPHTITARRQ
ncbi:MAG: serine hydrolase, partial [Anaerolineae bacterium]|nr:serine hydrolase [Anaerolineae bacterium]